MIVNDKILDPAVLKDGTTISNTRIRRRCKEVAKEIELYYGPPTPEKLDDIPIFVEVKFGAFIVYTTLMTSLDPGFPTFVGCVRAKSYCRNGDQSEVEITNSFFDCSLEGRRVLVIDDIVESGQTLAALKTWFNRRGAADVRTFALLDKPSKRNFDIDVDWVGFPLEEDQWVVGYGLDDNNLYRHFNNIVVARSPKPKLPR